MAGIREQQKAEKKKKLLDAAYDCFVDKGVHKTSIDDIVARAGVAKGTFYLYFTDKSDLSDQLCVSLSKKILFHAYHVVKRQAVSGYTATVLAFVDAIIEYLKQHKPLLALLEKNLSWPIIEKELSGMEDEEFRHITDLLLDNPHRPNESRETAVKYVYSILALCGSVGYSSIIDEQPDTIDNMKPVLYDIIARILK